MLLQLVDWNLNTNPLLFFLFCHVSSCRSMFLFCWLMLLMTLLCMRVFYQFQRLFQVCWSSFLQLCAFVYLQLPYHIMIRSMISKQLDLPPYICNPVGGVLSVFKSPVARTNKANLEQGELGSFQAPSAVLACVDSQQVKFLNGKMLPYVSIPHWDLVERWVIIVIVLIKYILTVPFADERGGTCMTVLFGTGLGSLPWKEFCELSISAKEKGKLPLEARKRELAAALSHK